MMLGWHLVLVTLSITCSVLVAKSHGMSGAQTMCTISLCHLGWSELKTRECG